MTAKRQLEPRIRYESVRDAKIFRFKSRGLLGRIVTKRYLIYAEVRYTTGNSYQKPEISLMRDPDGRINVEIHIREDEKVHIKGVRVWRQRGPWIGEIPEETGVLS